MLAASARSRQCRCGWNNNKGHPEKTQDAHSCLRAWRWTSSYSAAFAVLVSGVLVPFFLLALAASASAEALVWLRAEAERASSLPEAACAVGAEACAPADARRGFADAEPVRGEWLRDEPVWWAEPGQDDSSAERVAVGSELGSRFDRHDCCPDDIRV